MNLVIMVSFAYLQLLMLRLYRFSQERKVHVGMKRREGEWEGEREEKGRREREREKGRMERERLKERRKREEKIG